MLDDYKVKFSGQTFECLDKGFEKNESIDVVVRPEDVDVVEPENGMLCGIVDSVTFKGVHYEIIVETVKGTSKTVKMHILKNHDLLNEEAKEKISANDFTMDLDDVDNISDAEVIARANAQAWSTEDEEELISLHKVEYEVKKEPGTYPVTFSTADGTSITVNINVVKPIYFEDEKQGVGITAYDFYKTADELQESMALSIDLKKWANATAWDLEDDSPVEITDVDYDFDPENVKEGTYEITFSTMGRELKIHTTDYAEEGAKVGLKFGPEDIHVMSKMGVVG
jgi:hypothetical protein